MEKCEFLMERFMRGMKELETSKIRIMVMNLFEFNKKHRYGNIGIQFKDIHRWAEQREQAEEDRGLFIHNYEMLSSVVEPNTTTEESDSD